MKYARILPLGFLIIVSMAAAGHADGNPSRDVAGNCKVELDTCCKDVTPSSGRLLACTRRNHSPAETLRLFARYQYGSKN